MVLKYLWKKKSRNPHVLPLYATVVGKS